MIYAILEIESSNLEAFFKHKDYASVNEIS